MPIINGIRYLVQRAKGLFTDRQFGVEMELNIPDREASLDGMEIRGHSTLASYLDANTIPSVEVVAEGYNHRTRSYWKIVSDSSLDSVRNEFSCEIVSPPLKGKEGLLQLKSICAALNEIGATINKSHGIHVHQDLTDWKTEVRSAELNSNTRKLNLCVKKVAFLLDIVARFEPMLWAIQPISRLGMRGNGGFNGWSFGNGSTKYTKYFQTTKTLSRVDGSKEAKKNAYKYIKDFLLHVRSNIHGGRHIGLNFGSYWRYGTCEFRMAAGSANYTKIKNWIVITQAMVETANRRAHQGKQVWYKSTKIDFNAIGKQMNAFKFVVGMSMSAVDTRMGVEADEHYREAAEFMTLRRRQCEKDSTGRVRTFGQYWMSDTE